MKIYDEKFGVRTVKAHKFEVTKKDFEAHQKDLKQFEILNDADDAYQEGQLLYLIEINEAGEKTGRILHCIITYVSHYEQKSGIVVVGTKRI